jgi:ribonuclease Z
MMSKLFAACCAPALLFSIVNAQGPPASSMTVTLLGTGTPNPRVERMGPSILIEAAGKRLLFDVGRATTIRLAQAGIPVASVTAVFLTHLHSDHTVGLPDLWLTGWLPVPPGGRSGPLRVSGPRGTRAMMQGLETAYAEDIRMRTVEEHLPPRGVEVESREFDADGTIFDEDGVRVTAFAVDHGGELKPAFGYRVSYGGRNVVISGDTRFSENLIRHAAGADVLLHEVFAAPPDVRDAPSVQFRSTHHSSPTDAARVFERVKPRLAVFTHVALAPDGQGRPPSLEAVLKEASNVFAGRMEVGEDLMKIIISDAIDIQRARP